MKHGASAKTPGRADAGNRTRLTAIEDAFSAQAPGDTEDSTSYLACTKPQARPRLRWARATTQAPAPPSLTPWRRIRLPGTHRNRSARRAPTDDPAALAGSRITLSPATYLGHTPSSSAFERDCSNNWRRNPMTASVWLMSTADVQFRPMSVGPSLVSRSLAGVSGDVPTRHLSRSRRQMRRINCPG